LCKNHFSKDDFQANGRLKKNACPSVQWKLEYYPINKSNTSKYPPAKKAPKLKKCKYTVLSSKIQIIC
jgi:hypothetical protein